jgi:DNA-binding response OmpR family regulator
MTLDSIKNILVASDDEALVAAITHSLRDHGFEVCTAPLSRAHQPSLIVLDADLAPEVRARLLHTCRSAPTHATPPIVALSTREAVRQNAAEEGVWVCLAKPVELDSLLSAVRRISHYTASAA